MSADSAASVLIAATFALGNGGVLVWAVRRVQSHSEEMRAIRVTLFGEQGTNGINGEMKSMRAWRHESAVPALTLAAFRLDRLEDAAQLPPLKEHRP